MLCTSGAEGSISLEPLIHPSHPQIKSTARTFGFAEPTQVGCNKTSADARYKVLALSVCCGTNLEPFPATAANG